MSETVKRYNCKNVPDYHGETYGSMEADENGDYVRYSDYAKLAADNKALVEAQRTTAKLVYTLRLAKEKLEIYRRHSGCQYLGGMEYTALIKRIDDAIAALAAINGGSHDNG